MPDRVVPILRAGEPGATLEFWRALGFEVLHDQRRPYVYLSVRRGELQLDFSGGLPEGTMLVVTENADALHGAFRAGLKAALGRVPRTGLPRLGLVSQQKMDRRFNMVDPAGNRLIVLTPGATEEDLPRSPLAQAIKAARLSAYGQEDLGWAASHLDTALAAGGGADERTRLAAWVLRADLAALTGDREALARAVGAARSVELTEDARREAALDLERLEDLEAEAGAPPVQGAPA